MDHIFKIWETGYFCFNLATESSHFPVSFRGIMGSAFRSWFGWHISIFEYLVFANLRKGRFFQVVNQSLKLIKA